MNTPYVKQFDENGTLLNPIKKGNPYMSFEPNHRQRNAKKQRFMNNRANYPTVIFGERGQFRMKKVIQWIGRKMILHTIPV